MPESTWHTTSARKGSTAMWRPSRDPRPCTRVGSGAMSQGPGAADGGGSGPSQEQRGGAKNGEEGRDEVERGGEAMKGNGEKKNNQERVGRVSVRERICLYLFLKKGIFKSGHVYKMCKTAATCAKPPFETRPRCLMSGLHKFRGLNNRFCSSE